MDIHLLVINVGNTRMALGTFVGGELKNVSRVPLTHHNDIRGAIATAWEAIAATPGAAVAGASVNAEMTEQVADAVRDATGHEVSWAGDDMDVPIGNVTENPQETGVDRLLNVAAAYEQLKKSCVVVDAGTAVSISCCNDEGEFVGGAIGPGVAMMLDSLHTGTSRLPKIALAAPRDIVGKSTEEAIRHGVYHGIRGMVKEVVENFATQSGRWPEVIATGGDAAVLFEGWELVHAIVPDLTLYGMALAYAEHLLKNEQ